MMLIDFEESMKKPVFRGREGFFNRRQNGPFLLLEDDIRRNIHVRENHCLISVTVFLRLPLLTL